MGEPKRLDTLTQMELNVLATLHYKMISAAVLFSPCGKGQFPFEVDACKKQICQVLMQEQQDGTKRRLSFLSRTLSVAELNYNTTNWDFLAVFWAELLLCSYLKGQKLTICTNHEAFKWIRHLADATSKLDGDSIYRNLNLMSSTALVSKPDFSRIIATGDTWHGNHPSTWWLTGNDGFINQTLRRNGKWWAWQKLRLIMSL